MDGTTRSLSEKGADPLRRGRELHDIDSPPKGQPPFRTGSRLAAILILLFWCQQWSLAGAEDKGPNRARSTSETGTEQGEQEPIELPFRLPDGRNVRTIGLYQSQLDELIPRHFRPINIEQLTAGLRRISQALASDSSAQVGSTVYWVDVQDDLLVSDRSEIEIETESAEPSRLSLGRVNLAIATEAKQLQIDALPRLENSADGDLVAVTGGASQSESLIRFKWQLRGRSIGSGHQFEMRLPLAPQTRIVVSAPPDITIEALDGVLRGRTGPPPDAGTLVGGQRRRWYELDAGGLDRVRIRTRRRTTDQPFSLIVRNTNAQFRMDATGLRWNCNVQVQSPAAATLPKFQIRGGVVTGITVNSFEVPFTSSMRGWRQTVAIEAPESVFSSDQEITTVAIAGFSPLRATSGWCLLTLPDWSGRVEHASTTDHVHLIVPSSMQLAQWELPDDWRRQPAQALDDTHTMHSAVGPPPALQKISDTEARENAGGGRPIWSRVRLTDRPRINVARTDLRITGNDQTLAAAARMTVRADPALLAPLRIEVQEGWSIESVSMVSEGREIENPRLSSTSRILQIWPESGGLDENGFVLEIRGTRQVDANAATRRIPATWFVAPRNLANELTASITPPLELNWTSGALIQSNRIDAAQLDDAADQFLEPTRDETLLFRPPFGRTPSLTLNAPLASFDAHTKLFFQRDGEQWIEQLEIEIESSGKRLEEVEIQTGPSHGRPPFRWFIASGASEGEGVSFLSALAIDSGSDEASYNIRLDDQSPRTCRLIARRSYRGGTSQVLKLPTITAATSQQNELWLASGLQLTDGAEKLQSVLARQPVTPSSAALRSDRLGQSFDTQQAAATQYDGYRYAAAPSTTVKIANQSQNRELAIVDRASMRIVASSRGSDRIELSYDLAPARVPLHVEFDPSLRWLDSEPDKLAPPTWSSSRGRVTIAPHEDHKTVRMVWDRDQYTKHWVRTCQVPSVEVSGIVLSADFELIPAGDAFAPAAVLRGEFSADQRFTIVPLQAQQSIFLLRRNVVFALGWLLALFIFAIAWHFAHHRPVLLACLVFVGAAAVLLWWPWRLALCGWLILPMVAAGLLGTSSRRRAEKDSASNKLPGPDDELSSGPGEFSVSTVLRAVFWITLAGPILSTGTALPLAAQDSTSQRTAANSDLATDTDDANLNSPGSPPATETNDRPEDIDILVPVNEDGAPAGDTVYVAESVLRKLVPVSDQKHPHAAWFQSARYRVQIDDSDLSQTGRTSPLIEAEFLVRAPEATASTNPIRLPLAASAVRRIELLGANERIVPFDPDSATSIVVVVPAEEQFTLRAMLLPTISPHNGWNRLELPIPVVSAATVTIDSNFGLDSLRIGGDSGTLLPTGSGRRWQYELGPRNELVLDYRSERLQTNLSGGTLENRYLVDVGRRNTTIECQLQPPGSIVEGDQFKFILRNQEQPRIISQDWVLESTAVVASTRRDLTVRCTSDRPGAIRLLWTRPLSDSAASQLEPLAVQIPEVVAAGSTETAPAWIGLRCDPSLRFSPLDGDDFEPLSVDQFLASWQGYQGRLQSAYVSVDGLPNLVIEPIPTLAVAVEQQHHIHVAGNRIEMEYRANVTLPEDVPSPQLLLLPASLELQRIWINDQSQAFRKLRAADGYTVALILDDSTETSEIRLRGIQPFGTDAATTLPRIRLASASVSSDRYLISRDPTIDFALTEDLGPISQTLPSELAERWLRQGRAPVGFWQATADSPGAQSLQPVNAVSGPSGLVTVLDRDFDCQQLISIRSQDGVWILETLIFLDSDTAPDVIDVEVPVSWTEDLQVEGALQWIELSVQHDRPADEDRKIIRIRYDKESVAKRPLTIRSALLAGDASRLTIPSVSVLGSGERGVYLDLPAQSPAGEPIRWSTSAVESRQLPEEWLSFRNSQRDRATFIVARRSWSVHLAARPQVESVAEAYHGDVRIFPGDDGPTIHCRWDLSPGNLDSVSVRLPESAELLAAWHAGHAQQTIAPHDGDAAVYEIPLALRHLPAALEILFRVPPASIGQGSYMPELVDVPVARRWLVQYSARPPASKRMAAAEHPAGETLLPPNSHRDAWDQRQLSRARSVMESIQSVQRSGSRPQQEIVSAIGQWLLRYHSIRTHPPSQSYRSERSSAWQTLDEEAQRIAARYGIDTTSTAIHDLGPSVTGVVERSPVEEYSADRLMIQTVLPIVVGTESPGLKLSS